MAMPVAVPAAPAAGRTVGDSGAAAPAAPAVRPGVESWTAPVLLRLALGAGLLLGQGAFVAGAAWDVQWHLAVGRDRTFTPPHLLLLSGIAATGLLALAGVLWHSLGGRRWRRGTTRFLWVFRAPFGAYLAGFGALLAAVAFPLDDYWHRLYGIDVTLWAPFHVMIVTGMALAALGTPYVFASAATLAHSGRRRPLGLLAGAGAAVSLAMPAATLLVLVAQALDADGIIAARPRPIVAFPPLLVLSLVPWLVAAAPAARLPGGATLMALALTLLRYGLFAFVPWAVRVVAAAEQLPYRPSAPSFAAIPLAFPAWAVAAGLAVDGCWQAARRGHLRPVPVLLAAGTIAAVFEAWADRPWMQTLPLTRLGRGLDLQAALWNALPLAAVCGLAAAALGIGLGAALRRGAR